MHNCRYETDISHRRKGIASSPVKNFVNEATTRNYIVQWNRIESNVASKLLAEKFGFNLFKVRPYYRFKI
ncbi:MAG: GNAT family N-acetyltransferase [Clostridia bacterium]